jgi:hypothetical protein
MPRARRLAWTAAAALLAACGGGGEGPRSDAAGAIDGRGADGAAGGDGPTELRDAPAAATDAPAGAPDAALPDAVFDVLIFVDDTCEVTTTPASITVPLGTDFTVNWINSAASAADADVDKIDEFNQVPIVIGLEPGSSYHDTVREWCGTLFTGTFDFRITGCFDPTYLPVDCGG